MPLIFQLILGGHYLLWSSHELWPEIGEDGATIVIVLGMHIPTWGIDYDQRLFPGLNNQTKYPSVYRRGGSYAGRCTVYGYILWDGCHKPFINKVRWIIRYAYMQMKISFFLLVWPDLASYRFILHPVWLGSNLVILLSSWVHSTWAQLIIISRLTFDILIREEFPTKKMCYVTCMNSMLDH